MLRQPLISSGPVPCSKCSTNQSKKIAMSDSCAHVQRGRCALPNESVVFGMDGPRRRCVADCLAWKDLILASLAGANLLAHTLHVAGCCKEGNRTRARQHRNTSRDKAGCGLNPVYALPLALKDSAEEARTRAPMAPPAISWTFAPSSSSFAFFARASSDRAASAAALFFATIAAKASSSAFAARIGSEATASNAARRLCGAPRAIIVGSAETRRRRGVETAAMGEKVNAAAQATVAKSIAERRRASKFAEPYSISPTWGEITTTISTSPQVCARSPPNNSTSPHL